MATVLLAWYMKFFRDMNDILVIMAVIFFVAALSVGILSEDTWRNLGITWGLIAIGATLFGIALTL